MAKKVITNRMYQLYELRDSLENAIEKIKMVIRQQGYLIELIIPSKHHEELLDFTKGVTADCKNYEKTLKSYEERLEKVKHLIELYEKKDEQSEFLVKIVTEMIEALNIGVDEPTTNA